MCTCAFFQNERFSLFLHNLSPPGRFVRERFPGASVLSSLAGKQNFLLPTGSIKASQVVEILERDIEEFPFILDWSLSQARCLVSLPSF